MLRLLGGKTSSNVQKVLWLLRELDLPYQQEDYGGSFGGNKDPAYLRLNPNGVVPTLIDGDAVVWESNTVLRYIANRFGPTALYPADPDRRSLCERWIDWQLGTLNTVVTPLYISLVRTVPADRDAREIDTLAKKMHGHFSLLNGWLSDHLLIPTEAATCNEMMPPPITR